NTSRALVGAFWRSTWQRREKPTRQEVSTRRFPLVGFLPSSVASIPPTREHLFEDKENKYYTVMGFNRSIRSCFASFPASVITNEAHDAQVTMRAVGWRRCLFNGRSGDPPRISSPHPQPSASEASQDRGQPITDETCRNP